MPRTHLIPGSHEKGAEGHPGAVGGVLADAGTCPGCGTRGVFRARPAGSEAGRSDAEPSREGPALAGREGGSEEEDVRTRRQARALCPAPRAPGGHQGWRGWGGGARPAPAPTRLRLSASPRPALRPCGLGLEHPACPGAVGLDGGDGGGAVPSTAGRGAGQTRARPRMSSRSHPRGRRPSAPAPQGPGPLEPADHLSTGGS